MSAETITVQWVTAADADHKRHLAALDGHQYRALCGVTFHRQDTRRTIPRRCFPCLDEQERQQ